jgi:hypothetical protein
MPGIQDLYILDVIYLEAIMFIAYLLMFVIDQLDVTIFIPLFSLYMFRTILVHHQEICYVRHVETK